MKKKLDVFYDFKVMGFNAHLPFLISLLLILYSCLRRDALNHIIPALELTFPVFAAWWSIFLYQYILEEPGSETVFSYPTSRLQLGFLRAFVFFMFYLFLLLAVLLIIDRLCVARIFLPLAVQLGSEVFFFAGLGFWAITMTANSGWSLVILVIYSSTQILTRGALFPIINVFSFNTSLLNASELWFSSVHSFSLGAILWTWAQVSFARFQRYH